MIDTHLHVWDTGAVRIPWLADAGLPARAPIPDGQGRRYVLVEADAPDPAEEAAWLISLAEQDPRVHGVVASVALELPQAERALASLAEVPQVVGVRRLLQDRELFGSTALVEGLIRRVRAELGADAPVVATGGLAPSLAAEMDFVDHIDYAVALIDEAEKGEAIGKRISVAY